MTNAFHVRVIRRDIQENLLFLDRKFGSRNECNTKIVPTSCISRSVQINVSNR